MDDLKYIKKFYGENFAHLCRTLFPTLLEQEGLLSSIISKKFAPTHSLYDEVVKVKGSFKNYIYSFVDYEKGEINKTSQNPKELMDKAGYILYDECKTEDEIQSFREYYAPNEELCTFWGGRLNDCRVWFAVKKDVDNIKREDFIDPERQDDYGTSVISIQFTKSNPSTLSIKNRYNHRVKNPDATFSNDLDNIIEGLTDAFVQEYGVNLANTQSNDFQLDNFVMAEDGKFYRYNCKSGAMYYCENNLTISCGHINNYDKNRYLLIDNYLIDQSQKTIEKVECDVLSTDGFTKSIGNIENIKIKVEGNNKKIIFKVKEGEDVVVTVNKNGRIVGYSNKNVKEVNGFFLCENESLTNLDMPNLTTVPDCFMYSNNSIKEISLPSVKSIGHRFLYQNDSLTKLDLPSLTKVRDGFLFSNQKLSKINVPQLASTGDSFLYYNTGLTEFDAPNLSVVKDGFLFSNTNLSKINVPQLASTGDSFLYCNTGLTEFDAPNLSFVKDCFLHHNVAIEKFNAPMLKETGGEFLKHNNSLKALDLPNLQSVGYSFMTRNNSLTKLNIPNLRIAFDGFLAGNQVLKEINAPNLEEARTSFLRENRALTSLDLPKIVTIEDEFMSDNTSLKSLNAPKLLEIGHNFLGSNESMQELSLPSLLTVGESFMSKSQVLSKFYAPKLARVGDCFMENNNAITSIFVPDLISVGKRFLHNVKEIEKLDLPRVISANNDKNSQNEDIEVL
jgi:hypothetical protein